MVKSIEVAAFLMMASIASGAAAQGQDQFGRPPIGLTDAFRIAALESEVAKLTAEVKTLQAKADTAMYLPQPSEGKCRGGNFYNINDILARTRTYHAVIKDAESDYPLGTEVAVVICSAN